ncbi:tetratricopeptide repeat protein [Vibrio gangliei]|uniref:tetratricopeptide repeat protein n=1 Tax=Vibrio gangliei TaxID=2077090 RepID=UPI0013008FFE|nr:tetratricopeptide repeat protein [Vibrio gangliei]
MKKTFWTCFAFMLLFSTALQAKVYSSPLLNEASKLLTINPEQSLDITKQFMAKRKLVSTKSQDYTISRDGSEKTIRTPSTSVEALQIMANAYFELDSKHLAFVTLKEAETLSQQYQIIQPQLSTKLVRAELLWRLDRDPKSVLPMLTDIINQAQQKGINNNWKQETLYQVYMLQAEINAFLGDEVKAQTDFQQALNYLNNNKSTHLTIDYHLRLGEYYLSQNEYDDSLTELLTTYWLAIKESDSIELARTNLLLSRLFFARHVLDKALEHATEAADFYDNYPGSAPLSATVKLMADTYFKQGKYNLALVNYLNVLDNESSGANIDHIIQLRIDIANTYLKLFDFTHAEIYLEHAQALVKHATHDDMKAEILLLQASLALPQNNPKQAIASSKQALNIAQELQNKPLEMQAYQIMSEAYQQNKDYQQALQAQQKYLHLWQNQQERFNAVNEEVFRQQKDIIEKSLHYAGLEDKLIYLNAQYSKYQRATVVAMLVSFLLLCLVVHRGYRNQKMRDEVQKQTIDLYTHPRSGLQNLKLLNSKLPKSLERSNAVFEQWRLGELIHEPLSDRLSFVMFDLPFLRNIYLKLGYQAGLRIEKEFGEYMKPLVSKPARLYHFSDGMFLYIEPKSDSQASPEHFFKKIKHWIDDFELEITMDKHFKMGVAEYPFLPRAYTAINDKDLIDILFMAIYLARRIYDRYPDESAHWVYLSAIENAPAASFASDNIRHAFEQAVEQGLIKIHTSGEHDDLAKAILRNDDHSNLD